MRNSGLRNPAQGALICFAMFVGGAVSVWSGVAEMNALGAETNSSAAKIGSGLPVGIVGFLFQFNFLWVGGGVEPSLSALELSRDLP